MPYPGFCLNTNVCISKTDLILPPPMTDLVSLEARSEVDHEVHLLKIGRFEH